VIAITMRPISDRTPFTGRPVCSPFTAAWSSTLDLLDRELFHLGARHVVLEVDIPDGHFRRDGLPRADARASSTAVRLVFDTTRHGTLQYATDRYGADWYGRILATGWQDNVRAIALGLEALRKVDRYGIARSGEQYRGYAQLPAAPAPMTADEAQRVIERYSGLSTYGPTEVPNPLTLIRRARANTHPDRNGGDREAYDQVDRAAQVLALT
jgi:hypothetical protein